MSKPADPRVFEALTPEAGVYFLSAAVLARQKTRYQAMAVYQTPTLGKILQLDGASMTSERDEFFYHENIVHPALITQRSPRRALVIGGGDGGSAEELLKYASIERVVIAELDPDVVDAARQHLQAVHRGALDDPRVDILIGDGYAYLRQTGEKFDVIVMDLPDPVGPAAALYSVDFFENCDRALQAAGTLALHIGSPFFHPERFAQSVEKLRDVFPIVRPYLVHVPLYGAWWGMVCASRETDPLSLTESEVDARIVERNICDLQFYNGAMHRAVFALPNFVKALIS
ncbi:MAG: polyamine aminopropyltransferase [Burkholderiales bacterium]|nr:MAG: polyamine aminopropyltransferase [Burkholderiales bacterium]